MTPLPIERLDRYPDLYDEGWTGTVTTDHILAVAGGILGGALTCLALLVKYGRHLNRTSKGHRP